MKDSDEQMEIEEGANDDISECEIVDETLNNRELNWETRLMEPCDFGLVKGSCTKLKVKSVRQINNEIEGNITDDASDTLHSDRKRTKFAEDVLKKGPKPSQTSLLNLAKYMDKKMINGLTFKELEQFCLLKIHEVIMYQRKEGELYYRIKQQDQRLEKLCNTIEQLKEQSRYLVTTNDKLLSELRENEKQNLLPLKRMRTVAIQVYRPIEEMNQRNPNAKVMNAMNVPNSQAEIVAATDKLQQKAAVLNGANAVKEMPVLLQRPAAPIVQS